MSEVSKIVLTFFMMPEARWTEVENVVFFSNGGIVIKLPVKLLILFANFLVNVLLLG